MGPCNSLNGIDSRSLPIGHAAQLFEADIPRYTIFSVAFLCLFLIFTTPQDSFFLLQRIFDVQQFQNSFSLRFFYSFTVSMYYLLLYLLFPSSSQPLISLVFRGMWVCVSYSYYFRAMLLHTSQVFRLSGFVFRALKFQHAPQTPPSPIPFFPPSLLFLLTPPTIV